MSQIRREVEIHCTVAHKFIAECYLAYELPDRISLLIEYITGGDLFKEVYGKGLPERRAAARVIGPLLEALAYLHSCGLYHRDIKLENVLQCEGGIKLCDFGLAIDSLVERPVTRLGTTDYFSPEVGLTTYMRLLNPLTTIMSSRFQKPANSKTIHHS